MKLYWGFNSIPELQGLPKAQQRRLWSSGVRAGWRMPRVWGAYLLMALFMGVGIFVPRLLGDLLDGQGLRVLWGAVWGGLGGLLANQITTHAIRPVLAMHRRALEPRPPGDNSYYVPPAE
jgi:hypothetical protein